MRTSINLIQDNLEYFLKREGITEIVPEHRRDKVFTSPVVYLWLLGSWLPASYISYRFGNRTLLLSIFIPVMLFALFFLLIIVFYAIRSIRYKKDLSSNDAASLGGILIIGTPIVIALGLGLIFWSWIIPLSYFGIYISIMIIALLIQRQGHRIYEFFDLTLSVFRALAQSLKYIIVILPLLLVIILLSVFSSDLWKIIGLAPLPRLFSTFALILFPALLLFISSLEGQTKELVQNVSDRGYILNKVESLQFLKKQVDSGLVSSEEWQELLKQFNWRHFDKLLHDVQPIIHKKTKRWLALLIGLTSLVLLLTFFVYFFVFFNIAIDESTISDWTGLQNNPPVWVLSFGGGFWKLSISLISIAIAKVSFILAAFAAAMLILIFRYPLEGVWG